MSAEFEIVAETALAQPAAGTFEKGELAIKQFHILQDAWRKANDLTTLKATLDIEEAYRKFIQHQNLSNDFKNAVTADFILGERRMGEMLADPDFPKNKGGNLGTLRNVSSYSKSEQVDDPPTY